ncbi:MAG: GFA family protein [Rhodospirillaceae bacterium]|nr:GFA family protein [Rhodospirillaceae bacterium]
MSDQHEGGCVCGAVRYVTRGLPERVSMCHCTWCQRRTGSAFGTEAVFKHANVRFTGAPLRVYRHLSDESGRWLDQHFCATCGTNLGLTMEAVPEIRSIPAGTFDDSSWLKPGEIPFRHIFMRSDHGWAAVPEGMEQYAEHFRK